MKTFTERLESLREEAINILMKLVEPYGELDVERFGIEEPELGIIATITSNYKFVISGDDFDYYLGDCPTKTICELVDKLLINE